ncbi:CHAT domain-containing protein [Calothrix sp. CCY 0018]|uniref:CHAT domain-containing protein n=1 Tax=Calothrix sp. CCY 0018 TaxID=3103864 RepID=UPI0039C61397
METFELYLSGINEKRFKAIVTQSGETDSSLPFSDDEGDRRMTLLRSLEISGFNSQYFSCEEKNWMRDVGILAQDGKDFNTNYLVNIGQSLYRSLFPFGKVENAFKTALQIAQNQNTQLHVQLRFEDDSGKRSRLADYPWELIHDGQDFLLHHQVTFSRYIAHDKFPPNLPPVEQLNVLLISSAAFDKELGLQKLSKKEQQAIYKGLETASEDGDINLDELDYATIDELRKYLTEHQGNDAPHVVHFDGHGIFAKRCINKDCSTIHKRISATHCSECNSELPKAQGYLAFESEAGKPDYLSAKELGALLQISGFADNNQESSGVALVVLSACQSAMALEGESVFNGSAQNLINHRIPAVVAMQYSVRVDAATEFAKQFYRSLGQKNSLAVAISQGREAMGVEGNQWYRPVLYLRWQDNQGGQLFKHSSSNKLFSKWENAWSEFKKVKSYCTNTILVGRDKELEDLQTVINNNEIRAVIVSGQHNIGKTRLVLEATKHCSTRTVITRDPRSMSVSELLSLEDKSLEIIVVIEDPTLDKVEHFINKAIVSQHLKLVITLPTVKNYPIPYLGLDKRINHIQIQPLSEDDSRELLRTANADFDYSVESWVVKQAGGNPGILVIAAQLLPDFRHENNNFISEITDTLKQKVDKQFNGNFLKILQILSLLTYIGIKDKLYEEIEFVCQFFGDDIQPGQILKEIESIEKAGYVQVRGLYVEVIPPILANSLAEELLQNNSSKLLLLFNELSQDGRSRLLQRLAQLKQAKISWFWNELFSSNGLLRDLETALSNGQILRVTASAVPNQVKRLLNDLKNLTFEERKSIIYSERDALVWSIEELIFRQETSRSGIQYLGLLAETEVENYGSNSVASKFSQCFQPFHSQIPLSLQRRLEFFKTIIAPESSVESRLLGIKAIQTILYRWVYTSLREESGNKPIDLMPNAITWGEVWKYREDLLEFLIELAQSEEPKVAEAASVALPNTIAEFALLQFQFSPEFTLRKFKTLVDWVINNQVNLSVSKLADALESVYSHYQTQKEKDCEERFAQCESFLAQIKNLINQLDKADFALRLKRWAGKWTPEHTKYEVEQNGQTVYRKEKESLILAKEVIEKPEILSDELLGWLCSAEAQGDDFCFCLGNVDSERKWLPKIEEIGTKDKGEFVFSAYFGGLGKVNRSFVSERLDQLTKAYDVKGEAIVNATKYIGGDLAGVERVEKLIHEKRVHRIYVERVLSTGRWFHRLTSNDCLRLLKAIAGLELENVAAVIDFVFMWLHNQQSLESELAEFVWQCLEAPNKSYIDEYKCDQIACKLVNFNIERGFTLLETLLEKLLVLPYELRYWNPINYYKQREFWEFLYQADKKRAVRMVLSSGVAEMSRNYIITRHISAVVNQQTDCDLLLEFALENEKQAELVCSILSGSKPNFWFITFNILEKYPDSTEIRYILSDMALDNCCHGNVLDKLQEHSQRIEKLLNNVTTPSAAFEWLEELLERVNNFIQREK